MFLLDLFQEIGESAGDWWDWIYFYGGFLLGGSNAEKWGDHRKKKFFINNSVEAVILSKVWRWEGGVAVSHNILGNVLKQILIYKFEH